MKAFYEKHPLGFALGWIGIYVVGFSVADGLSAAVGIEKSVTAPAGLAMTAWLLYWLKREKLLKVYGLGRAFPPLKAYLYFLPLAVMVSANLWGGMCLRYTVAETVLYVASMICVGILEEVIFRGFLFKAMCRDSVKWAVAVSSVTFGLGHEINLLSGAQVLPTLLQIGYATAAGFVFTVIFHRSGSLVPCIAAHCLMNSLSAFQAETSRTRELITAAVLCVLPAAYGLYLWKTAPAETE